MSYTQVSSLDLNQTAFEKLAYFALRPELYFDRFAEVDAECDIVYCILSIYNVYDTTFGNKILSTVVRTQNAR